MKERPLANGRATGVSTGGHKIKPTQSLLQHHSIKKINSGRERKELVSEHYFLLRELNDRLGQPSVARRVPAMRTLHVPNQSADDSGDTVQDVYPHHPSCLKRRK